MTTESAKIIYTLTDEAPLLATCSLLPIIRTFTAPAGITIDKSDISVSARILAEFSDYLREEQRIPDYLAPASGDPAPPDCRGFSALPAGSRKTPQEFLQRLKCRSCRW